MILLKDKDGSYPKEVLEAVADLSGNADFEVLMKYFATSKTICAHWACFEPNKELSQRYSGGYIALHEIEEFVKNAETNLRDMKEKEKAKPRKSFA